MTHTPTAIATHIEESHVIPAPITDVWSVIKSMKMETWWSLLDKVTSDSSAPGLSIGSTYTLHFKDGTAWGIVIMEASELHKSVSFELVSSNPSISVSSALHKLSCKPVTATNQSFISWSTDFSNDASADTVLDSRFKKREGLQGLHDHFATNK
ncbi:bet v1-like protein [Nannochloropsis oceanica]